MSSSSSSKRMLRGCIHIEEDILFLFNVDALRLGALGLMLTAAALALMSIAIDRLSKLLGGARITWGLVNFVLAAALLCTLPLTKLAEKFREHAPPGTLPSTEIKSATLALFAATGIPQAATYSIPFALASMFSSDSGAGHGLSLGLMNLAICIPQMFVSLISGPWENLFGGGNLPTFLLGAGSAVISGILALTVLPPSSANA